MSKNPAKAKKDRVPFKKTIGWSARAISLSLNVILMGYLTFYCTDILGLSAVAVGTVLLLSKLLDGVTDLTVGFIIERTHTKWGKARPYEFFVVALWIFTVMLFNVPNIGDTGKYVYIFILYALANSVSYTFVSGNETVYLVRAFPKKEHQISLLSINGCLVMIVAIIFNIFFPQVVKTLGTTQSGWSQIAIVMAVPLALIGLLRFLFVPEVVDEKTIEKEKTEKIRFGEMIGLMLKNKYIWLLVGLGIIVNFTSNMTAVTTYYFKYIVGDIGKQSLPAMANMLTPVVILLFPVLCKKLGTTGTLRGGMAMSVIGVLIRAIGQTNTITIIIGSALFIMGSMPITMMIASYTAEAMDYGEWKNKRRIEGPLNSLVAFSQKVGPALASGVTGLIMGMADYDGLAEVQSSSANTAIVVLYNWIPAALLAVALVLTFLWKLDSLMPQIKSDLGKGEA